MIAPTPKRLEPHRLHCQACGTRWSEELLVNVPAAVYGAQLKALRCPACYANSTKIHLLIDPEPAPTPAK
jgi:uncharacterized protein with PIN domain